MDITNILIHSIENKLPISFSKYGDGEYLCANSSHGHNCDEDRYTEKLKNGIINSFKYMTTQKDNAYIGMWFSTDIKLYWENLVNVPIKWGKYHSLFICDESVPEKVELYKSIKESPLKKILISNPLLLKANTLLNIDYNILIDYNNWFDSKFDNIMEQFKEIIHPENQYIIILCAGMGSKVLICELTKLFPNNIYLDFGSALDKICTRKTSRGWEPDYNQLIQELHELIPEDWNHEKYNYIYNEASQKLGKHIPR